MNSYVNEYEMRLPRGYVDLSAEEMEYDGTGLLGGFLKVCAGALVMMGGGLSIPATLGTDTIVAAGIIVSGAYMVSAGANEMNSSF
jgi:hypothetical protein